MGRFRLNPYLEVFIAKIKSYPDLSEEEESDLFRQYQEKKDAQVKDKIIRANLKFVEYITRYLKTLSFYEDLLQSGFCGLIEAVDRFDPDFESSARFRTFAFRRIQQHVLETLSELQSPSDKRPEIPLGGISHKDIALLAINGKRKDILDKIAFNKIFDVFCKKNLTRREELVLRLSFGVGVGKYSRKEIAKVMNVSDSLVSLLKGEALKKLRKAQKEKGIFNDFSR